MKNMETSELKINLHNFIDQIDNVAILEDYYNELKRLVKSPVSGIWDRLTDEQKQEVLLSFEESDDENNLIDNGEVMKRYEKWL
jgi:hypothetical protein